MLKQTWVREAPGDRSEPQRRNHWTRSEGWVRTQLHHTPRMTHLPSKFNLRSVKQHARPALCNRPCRDEPWSSAPSILLTFLSLFLGSGVGLPRLEKNGGGADGHLGNNPGWSGVCLAAGSSSGRQGLGADAAEMSGYCKVL